MTTTTESSQLVRDGEAGLDGPPYGPNMNRLINMFAIRRHRTPLGGRPTR